MTESTPDVLTHRRSPKTSDVIGTSFLALLGVVALIMGLGYGVIGDNDEIGPGFLPVLTGAFIVAASLAEIGRLYFAPRGQSTAGLGGVADELSAEATKAQSAAHGQNSDNDVDTFGRTAAQRRRTVPLIFGILLASLLLIQVIGMLLSLWLMMLVLVIVVENKPLVPSLLSSLAVLGAAYLIFVQMLGVPLPQGLLGIL